jgi:hypothetical protein
MEAVLQACVLMLSSSRPRCLLFCQLHVGALLTGLASAANVIVCLQSL